MSKICGLFVTYCMSPQQCYREKSRNSIKIKRLRQDKTRLDTNGKAHQGEFET